MKESDEKHSNILIYGIEESKDSARETHAETLNNINNFLLGGLLIEIPITFADFHRLLQRPISKDGERVD